LAVAAEGDTRTEAYAWSFGPQAVQGSPRRAQVLLTFIAKRTKIEHQSFQTRLRQAK
jgi:hypothetical protein